MLNTIYENFQHLNSWDIFLLSAFFAIFIIRLFLTILLRFRLLFVNNRNIIFDESSISILLPFRNEETNLKNNLSKIIKNKRIEVIAVDDFSHDNSYINIGCYKQNDDRITLTSLNQETIYSEKMARNIALKAAKYNWVILIPPSTAVFHDNWLQNIKNSFHSNNNLIINYSNILRTKGIYNRLYRLEILQQFILSSGSTLNGISYLYNEDNIAFLKKEYFKNNGFKGFMGEHYAHLELVINQFIKRKSTTINFTLETSVKKDIEVKKIDYKELLIKRKKIEKNLSFGKQLFIHFNYVSQYLHLLLFITTLIVLPQLYPVILFCLIIFLSINIISTSLLLRRLGEPNLFLSSLFYDLAQPYLKLFYRQNVKSKKKRNGRSVTSSL